MDLRPFAATAVQRQELTSWTAVHQVLVEHQPVQHWWRTVCSVCAVSWPCPAHELALDELTGTVR